METAAEVILRPVPPITQINSTRCVSNSSEIISLRVFHEWQSFKQDVLEASDSLDLSHPVPYTDDVSESYVVGSELGLTGRFSKNVCDPVSKVFATTCLSHLKFSDYQSSAGPTGTSQVPEFTMFNTTGPPRPAAVGELKSFWTVELEDYSIREGYQRLIGSSAQLIKYMRSSKLRFGFLSTYEWTVFIRRTAPYHFDMSLPIARDASNPSLRQCFLALGVVASKDWKFIEPPDVNIAQLRVPTGPSLQASIRPSAFQNQIGTKEEISDMLGSSSILYGDDDGIATTFVNCKRIIQQSSAKAIYEVTWDGKPAIAKCWSPSRVEQSIAVSLFANEARTYENIHAQRPAGFDFFPSLLSIGKICCSSIHPQGYIIVITKADGERLDKQWNQLSGSVKEHIRSEIYKAIKVLRRASTIVIDSGMHNVLYELETNAVTMLDFEACEEDTMSPDEPEMFSIFGHYPSRVRVHHEAG
ncbi:hypothetical protein N7517_010955 [Penicillium concentricum]|uniref:Protein kinase domain-containing protein n=1 Tax=Penicillium concentricum TaxID=293559 RepID=A0A9W9RA12_9EURO|nr:uncharacterized protein N7517_010955 [Penicillium concentricum]KAJ5356346.1 hypothetical protein N7517_010955 [Penicillium concentricum]